MKYFKLHRWNLIRQYREEREEDARQRLAIKKRTKKLIKAALTYSMLKTIYRKFDEYREDKRIEAMQNYSASKIRFSYLNIMDRLHGAHEHSLFRQYC